MKKAFFIIAILLISCSQNEDAIFSSEEFDKYWPRHESGQMYTESFIYENGYYQSLYTIEDSAYRRSISIKANERYLSSPPLYLQVEVGSLNTSQRLPSNERYYIVSDVSFSYYITGSKFNWEVRVDGYRLESLWDICRMRYEEFEYKSPDTGAKITIGRLVSCE